MGVRKKERFRHRQMDLDHPTSRHTPTDIRSLKALMSGGLEVKLLHMLKSLISVSVCLILRYTRR